VKKFKNEENQIISQKNILNEQEYIKKVELFKKKLKNISYHVIKRLMIFLK